MKSEIEIIINKSEITAGTRGASLGPEAIITAARKKGSMLFGEHHIVTLRNWNHMLDQGIKFPYAKRIEGLAEVYNEVCNHVAASLKKGAFPIVMAGDHGSAGGTIAGVKAAYPDKRLGVIWIDAHGDLHTPYTTPSGNMHGMPLSTALGDDNIPCKKNEISAYEKEIWERLKATGVKGAKVNPEDLVFVGVRDTEPEEDAMMERLSIRNHKVEEIRLHGMHLILEMIDEQLKDCDIVYVSFDVDSMDPAMVSHGTGTPVPVGISVDEANELLTGLAVWKKVVCMEFVEVNPCLDEKMNKMAEVTFELINSVVNKKKEI